MYGSESELYSSMDSRTCMIMKVGLYRMMA